MRKAKDLNKRLRELRLINLFIKNPEKYNYRFKDSILTLSDFWNPNIDEVEFKRQLEVARNIIVLNQL